MKAYIDLPVLSKMENDPICYFMLTKRSVAALNRDFIIDSMVMILLSLVTSLSIISSIGSSKTKYYRTIVLDYFTILLLMCIY